VAEAPDGADANGPTIDPSVSDDGRYVAYTSYASNVVGEDTDLIPHVHLWDRDTDTTTLVSRTPEGTVPNGFAADADISADGRYVAYSSPMDGIVEGDTNGQSDVFVWDRVGGSTVRASVATGGAQATGDSRHAAISADGRHVAFASSASNLDGPDDPYRAVYVWDRVDGTTTWVSAPVVVDPGGPPPFDVFPGSTLPAISGDGSVVAYQVETKGATGTKTRSIWVWDRDLPPLSPGGPPRGTLVSGSFDGSGPLQGFSQTPAVSADGRHVGYHSDESLLVPGDTNGQWDVFVRDRQTSVTRRVSVATDGVQGDGGSGPVVSLSGDGRLVAFDSWATNLAPGDEIGKHLFLWDRGD
jgi:Tol biopolymer transport system component